MPNLTVCNSTLTDTRITNDLNGLSANHALRYLPTKQNQSNLRISLHASQLSPQTEGQENFVV